MTTEKKRINVYLMPETYDRIETLSRIFGLSKSAIASLALQSGVKALELAANPDWQAFFEAQDAKAKRKHYTE